MKNLYILILACLCSVVSAQSVKFIHGIMEQKAFIENRGQFNHKNGLSVMPLFGVENAGVQIYFTANMVSYRVDTFRTKERPGTKPENEFGEVERYSYFMHIRWVGANPTASIVGSKKLSEVFHYAYMNPSKNIYDVPGYEKITYKDLYPNIDVEFMFHPVQGIKYNYIVRPGGDVSQISWVYRTSTGYAPFKDVAGNIHLNSPWGDFIEHAPSTFYADNPSHSIVSSYVLQDTIARFSIGSYLTHKTIVIDPWTTNPTLTTQNKIYDIEKDAVGNIYVCGGYDPYKVRKYNAGGAALWTLNGPYGVNICYGDFSVSAAGESYIVAGWGVMPSYGGSVTRVSTAGTVVYTNTPAIFHEMWTSAVNCNSSSLYISGTRSNSGIDNYIAVIDQGTGNITSTTLLPSIVHSEEPRCMAVSSTGDIYIASQNNRITKLNSAMAVQYTITIAHGMAYYSPAYTPYYIASYNGLAVGNNFFVHTNGGTLYKRNLATGALMATITIPGGSAGNNSGVAVDACDNIYVGTGSSVLKYDANLTLLSTSSIGNPVYDVKIGTAGEILAGGANFLASINMSSCESPCTPLPVRIEQFVVRVLKNDVLINWKLSDFAKVSSVNVEKSTDGTHFKPIAVNYTNNQYEDKNAEKNKILYYRIAVTDKDGHTTYSNMLSAVITDETDKVLSLYPNPVSRGNWLNVDYYATESKQIPVRVIDALGKTVLQNTISIYPGINHIELDINTISRGQYWVITGNNQKIPFLISE